MTKLIGLVGMAGSGKGEVAKILVSDFKFVELSMSRPMKEFCKKIFEFSDEALYGSSELRNTELRTGLTPRYALQTLGDWGRALDQDCWINYFLKYAKSNLECGEQVVVSDLRFQRELERIKEEIPESEMWLISRPALIKKHWIHKHKSELLEIDERLFDKVISNDSDLIVLKEKVTTAFQPQFSPPE